MGQKDIGYKETFKTMMYQTECCLQETAFQAFRF